MPPTREGEYRAVGVCVDITDLKELEAELEQSRQRLEEILATIRDSFWSHPVGDGDEEIFLTDGVERLFGIPKEEAQRSRTALYRFIHPEDVHNLREKLYRRTPDGTNEYEFRIVRTDGEVRWVRARTYAQCDAEGNLTRVAGLAWDITEERRTRQALQLQIERQRTILEIAQLVLSNADAEVLLDRTAELLGKLTGAGYVGICEENAATGQGTVQAVYIHPETYEKGEAAWYRAQVPEWVAPRGAEIPPPPIGEEGYFEDEQNRGVALAGQARRYGWLVICYREPCPPTVEEREFLSTVGAVLGQGIVLRETLRQLHEAQENLELRVQERTRELEQLNRRLAESNADLQNFAYAASHDLQTPLRAIRQNIQFLERRLGDRLEPEHRIFLEEAIAGTDRMARLIDSLLVFSRIETRARPHQLVNMGTLVQEALEDLKPLLEEAQAQVLVRAEEMPALIGEPSQLRSLWINLISNAVKYRKPNEPPRVEIGHCEEATEYIFFVRDNGQGIAPEFQEEIFRLFRRLHPESEVPGTGMGLAICRRVVERHEGRIWVESSPGEGATFYFALPKKSAPSTLAEPIPTFP